MTDFGAVESHEDPFYLTTPRRRVSSSPDLRDTGSSHLATSIASPRATQISWLHPPERHSESSPAPATDLPRLNLNIAPSSPFISPTDVPLPPSTIVAEPKPPPTPHDPVPTWEDFPPLPLTSLAGPLSFKYYWSKVLMALGYEGTRERREAVKLSWKLFMDVLQVAFSLTFLVISSMHPAYLPAPPIHGLTEWKACSKPLGVWTSLWIARLIIGSMMSLWAWQRAKMTRVLRARNNASTTTSVPNTEPVSNGSLSVELRTISNVGDIPGENAADNQQQGQTPPQPRLPHTLLYSRLSIFISFLSVMWWINAQVFLYNSLVNCRFTSPHLWWTVFGLVCFGYFVVLEVLGVTVVVFIVGPLVLLLINSVLLCMGRPPVQPGTRINPTVGKLPKESVKRIPLIMYIPSPHSLATTSEEVEEVAEKSDHPYPPPSITGQPDMSEKPKDSDEPQSPSISGSPLLKLFKRSKTSHGTRIDKLTSISPSTANKRHKAGDDLWEAQWERCPYPFVRLSGTRATCHICLEEFEEPPKKSKNKFGSQSKRPSKPRRKSSATSGIMGLPTGEDPLKLEDAGDGAQPLRLLACGHVFHQTCIDPWLTDVSGRCPVCQRPVEIDGPPNTTSNPSSTARRRDDESGEVV